MNGEMHERIDVSGVGVRLRFAGHSDAGAVRAGNEDSFLAAAPLWVVADGMGGHANGELASQAAIAAFADARPGIRRPADVLETIRIANDDVCEVGGDQLSATTLTGVALVEIEDAGPYWMVFNVGDSRTYSWNGRTLSQLSIDHSAVQELVTAGLLSPEVAAVHPERNIVTRALGADEVVEPDIWLQPLRGTQTFLLCSDGLTTELDDDDIARIIRRHDADPDPDTTIAERLVAAAIEAGGHDNITVLVVESQAMSTARGDLPEDTIDPDRSLFDDTLPR